MVPGGVCGGRCRDCSRPVSPVCVCVCAALPGLHQVGLLSDTDQTCLLQTRFFDISLFDEPVLIDEFIFHLFIVKCENPYISLYLCICLGCNLTWGNLVQALFR